MRAILSAVLVLFLARAAAPAQTGTALDGFDAFMAETLKAWDVPGASVAIVRDNKVVLSKGYGLRDVAGKRPVTPETLFAIGSISKSFTVTVLGTLADEGKLDWDKPVREYLPDFRMFDAVLTDRMTPRDLVTHRSGLPRHDLLWYGSPYSREELYRRLRYLEPSKDFRSTFQYQNLMFMTAGWLAGRLADLSWEAMVRQRIFEPLGMRASNFSVEQSGKAPDHALPYQKVKEEVREVPFRNIDAVGPAGSINSSAAEMALYVLLHLNRGKFKEKQILSQSAADQMQTPQMVMPGALSRKELGHNSYGMGWFITTYRGHKVVHHGGGIDGFSALVSFLPQDNIGVVILTNLGGSPAPTVVSYNVFDRLLGLEQVGWTQRLKEDQKKARESREAATKKGYSSRREGTRPSHELKEYAGSYEHPGYGTLKVEQEGEGLRITLHSLGAPLKHFHYDVFETGEDAGNPLQQLKVRFHTSLQGDVESLSAPLESSLKEIVFTRVADKAMREAKFLEAFAGQYQIGPQTATVALQDGKKLTLSLPGQPVYDLEPVSGTRFNLKGMTGFSLEFKPGEAIFHQPNGTFVARKK